MKRRCTFGIVFVAMLFAIATPFPRESKAAAQGAVTLKFATLFPANSSLMRTLQAWGQSVRERTGGQVVLEFVSRGRAADEAEFVAGMRNGTYDGAVLTASGLNVAAPGVLALAAPGVVTEYDRLDRVRGALAGDFDRTFASAPNGGVKLLGWADYGRARLFATAPLARPSTMSGRKIWAQRNDVVATSIARATGARAVSDQSITRVAQAITAGNIDTVYGSSVAVVSQNWHGPERLGHVSEQSFGIIIGATVVNPASYNRIPQAHRAAFDQETARAHQALNRAIRRDDDRNYATALQRGVVAFDTNAARAEWTTAFTQARSGMGAAAPAALMGRIQSTR